jgi:hypothetical protein
MIKISVGNLNEHIVVPVPFRAGTQTVTRLQAVRRIAEIKAQRERTDEQFEKFKDKFLLR